MKTYRLYLRKTLKYMLSLAGLGTLFCTSTCSNDSSGSTISTHDSLDQADTINPVDTIDEFSTEYGIPYNPIDTIEEPVALYGIMVNTYAISGKITDIQTGEPIPNIQVSMNFTTSNSDDSGHFEGDISQFNGTITFSDIDSTENGEYTNFDTTITDFDEASLQDLNIQLTPKEKK